MASRLINVRLDETRLRKAAVLREQGVCLSDVVRDAIDERFEKVSDASSPLDVESIIERIFEQHPDPVDLPARGYDVHDRKAARAAIQKRLRGRS